jgi:hypothetical protein
VIGVKGNYEGDVVIAKTIQIVQLQMRANPDDVSARILRRMSGNTIAYPLSLALSDLEEYYRAGTFTSGLMKATNTVGDKAEAAKTDKENAYVIPIPAHDPSYDRLQAVMRQPGSLEEINRVLGKYRVFLGRYTNDPAYSSLRNKLVDCVNRRNSANRCSENSLH